MSMKKKQRTEMLSKIIEMQPPSWLDKETYQEYRNNREQLSKEINVEETICEMFDYEVNPSMINYNLILVDSGDGLRHNLKVMMVR